MAVWYLVEIRIPRVLTDPMSEEGRFRFPPVEASPDPSHPGWRLEKIPEHDQWVVKYRSLGREAAYPGYEMDLPQVTLFFQPGRHYEDAYQLPYRIFTDSGKSAEGHLTVRIGKPGR